MGQREPFNRGWRRTAIAALALLILSAGLCCLDQGGVSMHDHSVVMDLCFLMLAVPTVIPLLAGLMSRGFAVSLFRPAFAAVPLAVAEPPPRRIRLS